MQQTNKPTNYVSRNLVRTIIQGGSSSNAALGEDFLDYNSSTIHAYLWVLSDMIGETKTHAEDALDYLLKCNRYSSNQS